MKTKKAESKNVLLFGLVSFFTDISSEMIYPIIPSFLKALLKASAGKYLGIIEGIAETTASLGKVYFGYISDKLKKFKLFTILGYGFSAVSKIILLVATAWTHVLGARFFDRIGKSIRVASRDTILSESVEKTERGKAFGIQRAWDFAGASLGVLIIIIIYWLYQLQGNTNIADNMQLYKKIFLLALIPAFLGVIFLFFVKSPKTLNASITTKKTKLLFSFKGLDNKLKIYMLAIFVFALGNSSNQFLILRSRDIGFTIIMSFILYLLYNLTSTFFLPYFGKLSDQFGKKRVLIIGYLIYSIVYLGFGIFHSQLSFYILWILYGLYSALTEGVEKAYISDLSPVQNRGTSLGLIATIQGIGLLPASVIAGFLYVIHPAYPFILGGLLSLIASLLILFF